MAVFFHCFWCVEIGTLNMKVHLSGLKETPLSNSIAKKTKKLSNVELQNKLPCILYIFHKLLHLKTPCSFKVELYQWLIYHHIWGWSWKHDRQKGGEEPVKRGWKKQEYLWVSFAGRVVYWCSWLWTVISVRESRWLERSLNLSDYQDLGGFMTGWDETFSWGDSTVVASWAKPLGLNHWKIKGRELTDPLVELHFSLHQ